MQNIVSKIIMGTAIIVFSIILNSNLAQAQNCVPNDCEAMGYTKNAAACAGVDFIKCPFDTSKVFCHKEVCIGFEKGTPNCADGQTTTLCIDDNRYFKCSGTPCESGYSTASQICNIRTSCTHTQNSNRNCTKCIASGSCTGSSLQICPEGPGLGKRFKCTNACGESVYECCSSSSSGMQNCLITKPEGPALAK